MLAESFNPPAYLRRPAQSAGVLCRALSSRRTVQTKEGHLRRVIGAICFAGWMLGNARNARIGCTRGSVRRKARIGANSLLLAPIVALLNSCDCLHESYSLAGNSWECSQSKALSNKA